MPVVVLAPHDALFEKTISNMQESMARKGKIVLISDKRGLAAAGDKVWARIEVPTIDPFVTPLLYSIPVQLLAYHTAAVKGTDVDQPCNLAKSVTVHGRVFHAGGAGGLRDSCGGRYCGRAQS